MRLRLVRIAFVVVIAAVLAANLIDLWTIQDEQPYRRVQPTLYGAANGRVVGATFAVYYYLRKKIGGKHVVMSPVLHEHTWFFQRVSRLDLESSSDLIELDPAWVRKHRKRANRGLALRVQGQMRELYVFLDQNAERYVLTQERGAPTLILLSESRYRELTAQP